MLVKGGFPEEVMTPLREALSWAVSSIAAIKGENEPGGEMPSPRTINSELVESGVLQGKLAGEISLMRELSLPPESPEDAEPPPSMRSIEGMLATVESLLTLGRELLLAEKV